LCFTIALCLNLDDLGVMNQAIDGRDGHHGVGKDAIPCAKGLVRGDYVELEK
jgi:hypothetical protein